MMIRKPALVLLISAVSVFSCSTQDANPGGNSGLGVGTSPEWLIPKEQVLDGGPGKDGIPALDGPLFGPLEEATYLTDDDLVVGFSFGGEYRAYPHNILDWHEIVNDEVKGAKIAVTYCPLTGTGIGWNREIAGVETTFGVSGLLYNTNLIPYDRYTDSNWSQIGLRCVNGQRKGSNASTFRVIETTWKVWKELFPNSTVLSENTGFSRNYSNYPYGNYRTDNEMLLFPVGPLDDRLPAKERVLTVIHDSRAKVYRFDSFGGSTSIVTDEVNGRDVVIVGNKSMNYMVAFGDLLNNVKRKFTPLADDNPSIIFKDEEGNKYDLFGTVVEGPDEGNTLITVNSFMAFWFSIAPFYSNTQIYNSNG